MVAHGDNAVAGGPDGQSGELAEQGHALLDPVLGVAVAAGKGDRPNVVGGLPGRGEGAPPLRGLVHWALVRPGDWLLRGAGLQPHDGEGGVQLLQTGLREMALLRVPPSPFQVQAVDVAALGRWVMGCERRDGRGGGGDTSRRGGRDGRGVPVVGLGFWRNLRGPNGPKSQKMQGTVLGVFSAELSGKM